MPQGSTKTKTKPKQIELRKPKGGKVNKRTKDAGKKGQALTKYIHKQIENAIIEKSEKDKPGKLKSIKTHSLNPHAHSRKEVLNQKDRKKKKPE